MTDYRILNNNLVYDFENIIKVPQNNNDYFTIEQSIFYKKAIDVKFKIEAEINFLNFFLIIKSFVNNLIYSPQGILIIVQNENDSSFVTFFQNIDFFKKLTYTAFCKWAFNQIAKDALYVSNNHIYSFTIFFSTDKPIINLKPNYPWNDAIINTFWKGIDYEIDHDEIIKQKNAYIEKLEKRLKDLQETIKK